MIEKKGIVSCSLAMKLAILQSAPASLNTYRRSSRYIQFRDANAPSFADPLLSFYRNESYANSPSAFKHYPQRSITDKLTAGST